MAARHCFLFRVLSALPAPARTRTNYTKARSVCADFAQERKPEVNRYEGSAYCSSIRLPVRFLLEGKPVVHACVFKSTFPYEGKV